MLSVVFSLSSNNKKMQITGKNKKKNVITIIIFVLVVIALAYFLYTEYWPEKEGIAVLGERGLKIDRTIITNLSLSPLEREEFVNLKSYGVTDYTEQYSGIPTDKEKPAPPLNITVKDLGTGGTLDIFWQKTSNYPGSTSVIYRSTTAGKIGEIIADSLTGKNYRDRGLINGATYYYTVRIVTQKNNGRKESSNTDQTSGLPTDITAPNLPTAVTIENLGTGATLNISWQNPTDQDFSHIKIYRSASKGLLGEVIKDKVTSNSYQDSGLTNNLIYYYTLTSVDTSGNESSIYLSQVQSGRTNPFRAF